MDGPVAAHPANNGKRLAETAEPEGRELALRPQAMRQPGPSIHVLLLQDRDARGRDLFHRDEMGPAPDRGVDRPIFPHDQV